MILHSVAPEQGRRLFRALRLVHPSLEDNLMITSLAVFVAYSRERCSLSVYHQDLLGSLFAIIFTTCTTAFWAGRSRVPQAVTGLWRVAIPIMGRAALLAMFAIASIVVVCDHLKFGPRIFFSQPAMAVRAFGFLPGNYPPSLGNHFEDANKWSPARSTAMMSITISSWAQVIIATIPCFRCIFSPQLLVLPHGPYRHVIMLTQVLGYMMFLMTFCTKWNKAQKFIAPDTSENAWGFGQIVPMFLLMVPIMTFVGASLGEFATSGNAFFERVFLYPPIDPVLFRPFWRFYYILPLELCFSHVVL
jgi:hypothetical protein